MTHEAIAAQADPVTSAQTAAGVPSSARASWLVCRAGAILCALPIEQVIEIMRLLPTEQIGSAPRYVRGLSVIRGTPVPVVDLGLVLGDKVARATRLIAVRAATRTIALAVESVIGITAIAADTFSQLPPLLRDAAADVVAAIAALDGELIVLLRAARLVPEELLARLETEKTAP
jgi:purine-binding chemotaxis protein CheW